MAVTHLLIDLENVQPEPEDVRAWIEEFGPVWVFHGVNQRKLLPPLQAFGDRVTAVPTSRPGKNALDFHLVFYLGYLASRNGESRFVVLSKDKGYDPAIEHARMLDLNVTRRNSLGRDAPKPPVKKLPSKKSVGPAKQASPAAGAKTAPAHRSVTASDLRNRVIEHLRAHAKHRPAKRATLERHVATILGGKVVTEPVQALIAELERDGIVKIGAKTIEYNLPKAGK
jgi:hypothetical protein